MRSRHLVLVGLMGAGKTSVGEECAHRLGRPFVDTDALVVAAAGVPFDELWSAEGEAGFRAREAVAVADASAAPEPVVIATGGGAVLDPVNRRTLRERGVVVWLDASPGVLRERVVSPASRPLLAGEPEVALARLARLRAPAYEAAAHARVDTEGRTVGQVADTVLEEYDAWSA